jgi:hypothetical protein
MSAKDDKSPGEETPSKETPPSQDGANPSRSAESDFDPLPIRGEPLSETIIEERR